MKTSIPILILSIILMVACKPQEQESNLSGMREHTTEKNVVVVSAAKTGTFYREFENNGKLEARQKALLNFEQPGKIVAVEARNGQWVNKGDTLARIDDMQEGFSYEKACRILQRSRLTLEETLINQGYSLKDSANVPENIMEMALIRSGYPDALNDKEMAAYRLRQTLIIAPFDGIVADLAARPYNETSNYKSFCTLIDNRELEVSFPVLESEMAQLETGMEVEVIPFAFEADTFTGVLTEINPKVAENGMVEVKALVKNKNNRMTEGMNVKVMVKKALGGRVYIPKEAVTLRQERNVVFVHSNDTAYWRYVDVGETNSRYTVIKNNISEGDEVIIEGHFNLAHLSPVEVIERKP